MELWAVSNREIIRIAEKKSGKQALEVNRTSGLYVYVTMTDGSTVTVYEREID